MEKSWKLNVFCPYYNIFVELWIWLSVKFQIYDGTKKRTKKKQVASEISDKLKFFIFSDVLLADADVVTIYYIQHVSSFIPLIIPSSHVIIGNKQFSDTHIQLELKWLV